MVFPLRFRDARFEDATSTAARRLDFGDVDLFHLYHRIERALGGSGIGTGYRFGQSDRRNLPGQSPFVLAPAALTLFAAVADDRIPITISFGLVSGCDLKRERFVVLERRSAVEPEARNAHHGKLDGQHVPFLPRRKVSRCAVHRADGRIGKGLGVKSRRVLGVAIIPKANRVLCWPRHVASPSWRDNVRAQGRRNSGDPKSALLARTVFRQHIHVASVAILARRVNSFALGSAWLSELSLHDIVRALTSD